jgi:hypothetical protein
MRALSDIRPEAVSDRAPLLQGDTMNIGMKLGMLSVAAGLALSAGDANAVVTQHSASGNAVNFCQAFTPGPANTIRNRVVGAENVGPNVMNVACSFQSFNNGTAANPKALYVYFSNNTAANFTVTCSLLTGYQGESDAYISTKSAVVPAGSQANTVLFWTTADNPVEGATNLGNQLVGINCTLPVGAVINDTYLNWDMNNGV